MKKLLKKINDMFAASALAEMGLTDEAREITRAYDQNHGEPRRDLALPDECQYGDNDICFVEA